MQPTRGEEQRSLTRAGHGQEDLLLDLSCPWPLQPWRHRRPGDLLGTVTYYEVAMSLPHPIDVR